MAEVTLADHAALPRVSVVIPSYNHARFIGEAIESVLAQTMSSLELIIIDDGSRDDSVLVATAMAAEDDRIRVVRQDNAGSHAAINRGLSKARGAWLAVLNSDDIWEPERLEQMLKHAEREDAQFLFSDIRLIDADGEFIDDPSHWWNFSVQRLRERVRSEGVVNGLLYGNFTVSTSNFLFRKELLASVGWFRRFRYNLDWDYVLRCLDTEGVKVEFVDQRLMRYRLHGDNAILSGMPGAAAEAQLITRQIYRRRMHAPQSLLLSHHRHDRLLRRYLQGQVNKYRESFHAVEADRDAHVELLKQRQQLIEAERRQREQASEAERRQAQVVEAELREALIVQQEQQASLEQVHAEYRKRAHAQRMDVYGDSLRVRYERDLQRCREVRMLEHLEGRNLPGSPAYGMPLSLRQRASRAIRSARRINESIGFLRNGVTAGTVRHVARDPLPIVPLVAEVAVHLHIFYRDLAPELIADALRIPNLRKVVITGPWSREDFDGPLDELVARGVDVQILVVPNRGKDVGGLLAAIRDGGLLDSDLVLKLHSKKSHNPESYFQAISALFGQEIRDGDHWRRALVQPLTGSTWQINNVLKLFQDDPAIGMVGARPFITSVPDANAALSQAAYERFGVPQGAPFVAGTMFWIRSSLLRPLLELGLSLDEFSLDSREVEGGLEHVMERMLGALVIGRGFDIFGVEG